jgi:PAS domain S-box-containing protein
MRRNKATSSNSGEADENPNSQPEGLAQDLATNPQRYRLLAQTLPVFIWTAKPDGSLSYANPQLAEYTGHPHESLLGKAWQRIIHPEDLLRVEARWQESLQTGTPYECEFRIWSEKQGRYRWFLHRANPCRDERGAIVRWLGCGTDIDDQKRSQQALQVSESRFRTLLSSLAEGVTLTDAAGRYAVLNPSAERILGLSADELACHADLPANWRIVRADGSPMPNKERPDLIALRTGTPQLGVVIGIVPPDRDRYWISCNSTPLFQEGTPQPYGVVTSFTDITQRLETEARLKRSHDELERANEQLRNLDHYKDEFLSSVSHELRGPLSLITGYASMLSESNLDMLTDAQREFLYAIVNSTENLAALVDDLLDFGAIKAGRFTLHTHTFGFAEVMEAVVLRHAILAEEKKQSFTCEPTPDLPEIVADAQRIRQILGNLLSNAIKYTPEGGHITVRAWTANDSIYCEVEDDGAGIAPDDQKKLFNRFSQLDPGRRSKYRSSGLGLSIAKALVEAHGGTIGVKSQFGSGSTFWFTIPLHPPLCMPSEGNEH